jgi:hypothetical protein
MPYASLASLLTLLLIQSPQSGGDSAVLKHTLSPFYLFPLSVLISLAAVACVGMLTAFFAGFVLTPVLVVRWVYREAVLRWMNRPGGSARAPGGRPSYPPTPTHAPSNLRIIEIQDPDASRGPDAGGLNRRASEVSRAVTLVYVTASTAYAVAVTPLAAHVGFALKDSGPDFAPFASFGASSFYLSAFVALLWLPVLMFLVIAVGRTRLKLIVAVAYSLLLSTPILFLPEVRGLYTYVLLLVMWIQLMSAPTGTMLVLRLSGVGGLALGAIFSLAAAAFSLGYKVINVTVDGADQPLLAGDGEALVRAWDVARLASLVFLLVGPMVAAAAAAGLLWWTSKRYARGETSEQIILLDIFMLATTFTVTFISHASGAGWYTMLGPLSFAVYELVVWAGLRRLGRAPRGGRAPRLLLLRVFGARRRSEWLLKRLGNYWRYSGSIQLIAAPDLAAANLDLDELLDFLRGRLKKRFVKDTEDCARRVESLDVRPDPDGRYRVNEFFCHADVWHETVAALTRRSDAVLMDLRGFTSRNHGCVDELFHVVNAVPVNRLVITVNKTTDLDFLRQTFYGAWAVMGERSPNRELRSPVLRLLHIRRQNSRAVRRLLSMLGEAAESEAGLRA